MAWRISNEPFWNDSYRKYLSNLKVEVGYGVSGNNAIGNYIWQGNVGTINYVFGGQEAPGSVVNEVPNSFLTWEETEQWDIGVDMGFLSNRLNLSVDLYSAVSRDFLIRAPVPRSTGFSDIVSNAGSIRNQGLEINDRGGILLEAVDEFLMNADNPQISSYWNELYDGISRCNYVLENIDGVAFNSSLEKRQRRGEVLFMRSWFYYAGLWSV